MTILFSDNFTGVSGTALNGRAATGGSWTGFGVATADQNGLKINATNQVRSTSASGCLARAETGSADHYAKVALWVTSNVGAVAVRASDHLNFLGLRVASATQIVLFKRIGGTETSVATLTVPTITPPATLEVRVAGANAFVFLNGVLQGSAAGYPIDPALPASTKAGLWGKSSATDPLADDFEAGTLLAALTVAGGRSASRGGATMLGGLPVLAVAGGRSSGRAAAATLGLAIGVGAMGGRSGSRAGVAGLALALTLAPMRGRSTQRAGGTLISLGGGIVPARGRSGSRGGGVSLGIVFVGTPTGVPRESRTVPVPRG